MEEADRRLRLREREVVGRRVGWIWVHLIWFMRSVPTRKLTNV